MRTLMITLLLIFAGTNLAYASHLYGGGGYDDIARAAHQLENAAWHFHQQLRYDTGRGHTTKDAKRLAKAARHFHRQVERGKSYSHIRRDYAKLANAYAHVRNEFGGRHDLHHRRHLRGDFRGVERAFNNLNRAIEYSRNHYSRHGNHHRFDRDHGRRDTGLWITFHGVIDG